jgi:hypothetical protein
MIRVEPTHVLTYAGAQVSVYHANKGEGLPKHEHLFSHATMCHSGSCVVRKKIKSLLLINFLFH